MRPLRLLLDGFGSYREPAEADFADVDFFALVGPTGSGKSTVIDGLCFALYGTVPRWGRENVIAQALAPAANACRVCLVFEAAGRRYGVVRALTRDKKGLVHTKEARLELLDPQVPASAPLADLLAASIEALAEGPDQVKSRVQDILGLTYEHFTQSVLLPQGRFSEFLHAKAADRQDLLVELLAFGVYNLIGQQARRRAELARERLRTAQAARQGLADASEEAENRAAARLQALAELASGVEEKLTVLRGLTEQAGRAAEQAQAAAADAALLAAVRAPAEVPGLARRIRAAAGLVAERAAQRDSAEQAELAAQQARDELPDKTRAERLREAYAEHAGLRSRLEQQQQSLAVQHAGQDARSAALKAAEVKLMEARQDLAAAERSHAAVALAQDLAIGADCPVCLRPVTSLPHHPVPADLMGARAAADWAASEVTQAQAAHDQAAKAAAVAGRDVEETSKHLDRVSAALDGAPSEAEVSASLEAIIKADELLGRAQQAARAARQELAGAEKERATLSQDERRAWADLGTARDSVVRLGAPATADTDLAAAWAALTGWARAQQDERKAHQADLDAAAGALHRQVTDAQAALAGQLAEHGITGVTDPARCEAAVATHRERAANQLAALRASRAQAAELDDQILAHREDEQVATMLGRLLRASSFERWLCGEALDSLVAEASETLLELSGGQYQLDRDERNDLFVIDYQDAGARRPVHTLSGGETFQASLALALALSRQVIGLSAGMRDLNSMFLDEGFGTLDEDTLETVGATLERLSADADRMIGIITHVPALAERVPVRFVVSRAGTTSTLRREGVA
ncbi:MAG TPA: SMC family ATPase [Streptosporangiaceae bacterium]|nr:SMC family ATPase [Streptosporangiaceae bacterium]